MISIMLAFSLAAYMDSEPWISGVLAGISSTLIVEYWLWVVKDKDDT